jgi:hypothetical protein
MRIEPATFGVTIRRHPFLGVAQRCRNRCSYIQARAVKKLSYVAWDLGAGGADAAAIGASRR